MSVKRNKFIKHLNKHHCQLHRHGGKHDVFENTNTKKKTTIPRHPQIDKLRHLVKYGQHVWEIDEFFGDNAGLLVAEIELSSEDEEFEVPDWAGEDVTQDGRYYNVNLVKHPFNNW